ncbi:nacht and ankyrin domain protein [Colletotrichum asianum]|uniref:Nacht and ankyrin domain protein n=1 Tax=Colletotrichum asianum TaxID=702518 RepID=A0A8H3ZLG4_9PEZI|nr:nacht and ankyrin domain protein [Colletotrichum asianum]
MATQPQGLRREDFQIAIICAIGCEYNAVTLAFDEIWEGAEVQLRNAPKDRNKYTVGRIANRNAVLLLLSGIGKVNAAREAVRLQSSYTGIKLAILAGICGGVPGVDTDKELLLGDVIISRCIVQYDLGRRYADGFVTKDTIEDSLGRPHESVRSLTAVFETNLGRNNLQRRTDEILESIQGKSFRNGNIYQRPPAAEDRRFEPGYLHRHYDSRNCECNELGACESAQKASCAELQCDSSQLLLRSRHRKRKFLDLVCDDRAHDLRVVIGRLGSGDTVMKSGLDRDRIAEEQNLVAFEMEGAGIWDQFPCVVVKAVCDYANSHKNKNYQNFAAARAASATKAILEAFPCTDALPRCFPKNAESFDLVSRNEDGFSNQKAPEHAREYNENDRKLLHLLAADHEAHKNFNPRKVSGTCEWFLRVKSYRKWLESTTSNIIWVSAGPGCGKSVLARALIDDGRLSSSSATSMICYFFFKDGDKHRVNSSDALSAILHQLFTQDQTRSLISRATSTFDPYGDQLRNNFYQLWKILVDCATNTAAGEIVCVLDALDECSKEGRQELFQVLETFYFGEQKHAASSQLKFLITSRPYDDLEISFERIAMAQSYIRLDGDDKSEEIRHEIDLVIDHKVNEFGKDFREEHRQAISKRLKAMENRTYLWLHLTLSIIDKKRSAYCKPSSVQTLLSSLPSSVFDAYEKILSHSRDKKQARNLLNIILAATQPLTLDEINWALTLQAKDFMDQKELEDDVWPRDGFKMTVKNLCGLFVSVVDKKVSFIHQTAREFLMTTSGPSSTWKGSFDMSSAHGKILISCVRLLSLHDVDSMIDNEMQGRGSPFMAYALHHWILHYNSQGSDESCGAARELCRTASAQAPMWAWYLQRSEAHWRFLWNCTDLTLACYLGLLKVVEQILEKENVDVDSEGGYFGTATQAAAAAGHLPLIQLLLRHGATWEVEGEGVCGTALEAAIVHGHFEVAECLIVERGDPMTHNVQRCRKCNQSKLDP